MGKALNVRLDRRLVEKRHALGGVDQQVKVAHLRVVLMQDGTEDARIPTPVRGNDPTDFFTVSVKGHRGFHSLNIARRGLFRLKIVTIGGIEPFSVADDLGQGGVMGVATAK